MYDPANSLNNNGIYPLGNATIPTIKGRKLMIPIPFCFVYRVVVRYLW